MVLINCTHCGTGCDGLLTLSVHLCSLRVNQMASPWSFCSEKCRATWFETATEEHLFAVDHIHDDVPQEEWPLNLHIHDGAVVLSVIHHDGGEGRFTIDIPTSQAPTIIAGTPVEFHSFEHPHHVNQWWTGLLAHEPMPNQMSERIGY